MMGDIQKTPAAKWRQEGQADPHGDHYSCQRAALTLGEYTDDELANGVFLHGNEPLNINALLRKTPGYHSAIVWLTAAKDRIRWLSRSLEESSAREQALQLSLNAADQRIDEMGVALNRIYFRCETFADDDRDMRVASVEVVRDIASRAINAAIKPEPGEPDHQIPGTSGMRLNMLANQGE